MYEEPMSSLFDVSETLEIMTLWCLRRYFCCDCLYLWWFMHVFD